MTVLGRILLAVVTLLVLAFLWFRQRAGGVMLPDGQVVEPQVVDIARQAERGQLDVATYNKVAATGISGVGARRAATPGTDANRKLVQSLTGGPTKLVLSIYQQAVARAQGAQL